MTPSAHFRQFYQMRIIRIALLKLQALKLRSTLFELRELDQKDANEKFKIAEDSKKRLRSKFIGSVHSANTRLEAEKTELIKEIEQKISNKKLYLGVLSQNCHSN